jgi:hypothetical protein
MIKKTIDNTSPNANNTQRLFNIMKDEIGDDKISQFSVSNKSAINRTNRYSNDKSKYNDQGKNKQTETENKHKYNLKL